jgi:hypothetical protein
VSRIKFSLITAAGIGILVSMSAVLTMVFVGENTDLTALSFGSLVWGAVGTLVGGMHAVLSLYEY